MSDIREDYGHEDPWGEFEDAEVFGADALYCGPHEVIEDLILLTEVCLDFEHWADDFRYWDRLGSKLPNWEEFRPFSELKSIEMAENAKEVEGL